MYLRVRCRLSFIAKHFNVYFLRTGTFSDIVIVQEVNPETVLLFNA